MAKRRRLEAPDSSQLADLEAGFAAKPVPDRMGLTAPIAQVAAEIAQAAAPVGTETRVAMARDATAANEFRAALAEGRVLADLPLDAIEMDHIVRDRMIVAPHELEELKTSIRSSGMRLPIEVVALDGGRYGLISGWRRVTVLRQLQAEEPGHWPTIRALLRPRAEAGPTYAAMVEENELRSQLTPYERGRIAVVAATQGAFAGTEAAVDAIFAAASKAKRSKIRSFALVHEELGDLLAFPTDLSERNGLRLAAALRQGLSAALRAALETGRGIDAETEWAVMEPVVRQAEQAERPASRGGRPKTSAGNDTPEVEVLANGLRLEQSAHADGFTLRVRGRVLDRASIDTVMAELRKLLQRL